jgi:hypothetical protein
LVHQYAVRVLGGCVWVHEHTSFEERTGSATIV